MDAIAPLYPSRRMVAAAVASAAAHWVGVLVLVNTSDGPVEIAERYLKALSEGDAESAERLIHPESRAEGELLADQALTTRWSAEDVEVSDYKESEFSDRPDVWIVSYTLRYGEREARGRLELTDDGGPMRVSDPYVELSVSSGLGFIEFNDLMHRSDPEESELILYPGVYHLFGSYPDFVDPAKAVVLLADTNEWLDLDQETEDIFAISDDLQDRADREVREWVDECADRAEITAAGCPFGTAPSLGGEMDVDTAYDDVTDLAWQVEFYPVIELQASWNGLYASTRVEGSIILTAEATPRYHPDEGTVEVEGLCRIHGTIEPGLTEDGELTLHTAANHHLAC